MAGLKHIKAKIKSVQKTRTVTRAMEAVSAVKMRKSQERALAARAYARAAVEVLARVSGSRVLLNHPLVRSADTALPPSSSDARVSAVSAARTLYVVITSDKGLAGSLNSGVLRATLRDMAARGLLPAQTGIIAVGRKAQDFFATRGFVVESYRPNTDAISAADVEALVAAAAQRFVGGSYARVAIVYQNFISTFEQRPTVRTVFPLRLDELRAVVDDIAPARGKYAQTRAAPAETPSVYTIEPSAEEVLDAVLPKLAGVFVYHALLESQASEHSARMVAMKSASDKAQELSHVLTLRFNKARQAAITREVSEITGGMEAMAAA